jgi:hypothetical protein
VKRSSSILKSRFGTVTRSGLRFGAIFASLSIAALVVLAIGVALIVGRAYVAGVPVAVAGFAALIGVGMYAQAAGMYMRTILYRYAMERPIPDLGVDVGGAFQAR